MKKIIYMEDISNSWHQDYNTTFQESSKILNYGTNIGEKEQQGIHTIQLLLLGESQQNAINLQTLNEPKFQRQFHIIPKDTVILK